MGYASRPFASAPFASGGPSPPARGGGRPPFLRLRAYAPAAAAGSAGGAVSPAVRPRLVELPVVVGGAPWGFYVFFPSPGRYRLARPGERPVFLPGVSDSPSEVYVPRAGVWAVVVKSGPPDTPPRVGLRGRVA